MKIAAPAKIQFALNAAVVQKIVRADVKKNSSKGKITRN